jgi:release factor glutamine methyltransferase
MDVIAAAAQRLDAAGIDTARLDAEILMAEAMGVSRVEVLASRGAASPQTLERFETLLARRLAREPIAYIVGHKEFFSLEFEVTPAVLIPRPETEFLVTAALGAISRKPGARLLDIGTGSGAIAIAFVAHAPGAIITAVDISAAALAVARRNANRHGVTDQMRLVRADLYEVLDGGSPLGRFDVIASNPPYIGAAEVAKLAPEIRMHEPVVALTDCGDGLDFYRRIAAGAREHLAPEGQVMVEIGAGQQSAIAEIFARAGLEVRAIINDLEGIARVLTAEWPRP